ncbi:MAG: 3-keto-disaccharide hydrolase [Planctomycetota bacterium]
MVRAAFLFVVVLIPALSIEGKEVEGQRPTKVWNRTGSLGEAPERVADDYPLSDQQNNDETNWISLFNGKNLDGWRVKCRPGDEDKTGYWKVVDGTITADTPPNSKHHYIWLLTEKEYSDFELRLKIQTYPNTTGNSGIQVRSRYDDEAGWLDGPQVDINPPGPWRNGFIYDETRGAQVWLWPNVGKPANAKPEHAPEGWKWFHADNEDVWNDVHIVCKGTWIKTMVNGVPIANYDGRGRLDDEAHRHRNVGMKGHIGLQIHPGKELLIRFKDIRARKLD